jgi:hypothetical protein
VGSAVSVGVEIICVGTEDEVAEAEGWVSGGSID